MMQRIIAISESTAAKRRLAFYLREATDGITPIASGTTFSASDFRVSKNGAAAANSAGSIVSGTAQAGLFYYEPTQGECDTEGLLSVVCVRNNVVSEFAYAWIAGDRYLADGLLNRSDGVESGYTVKDTLKIVGAAVAAKLSGLPAGPAVIRNLGDSLNRITVTFDANTNRTNISFNLS
jgi:hypothetical protein